MLGRHQWAQKKKKTEPNCHYCSVKFIKIRKEKVRTKHLGAILFFAQVTRKKWQVVNRGHAHQFGKNDFLKLILTSWFTQTH